MEDNEFEEVTIISHTDRAQRVFSENFIEKLKDQISLEIVKEINGTEDKTYSDDPRLAPGLRELEKLKKDHFGEGEGKICDGPHLEIRQSFYFISRVAGESGQYLLGAVESGILANGIDSKVYPNASEPVFYLIWWGDHLFLFDYYRNVTYFDRSLKKCGITAACYQSTASWGVLTTPEFLYFLNNTRGISRLNKKLEESTVDCNGKVRDFFVCPKTETITTLEEVTGHQFKAQLVRGTKKLQLGIHYEKNEFHILKKMYSDHFLVGETNRIGRTQAVIYLVDYHNLQIISDFKLESTELIFQNIRLLAPRHGINCFLVAIRKSLELFCEYRLKLYHLKTLEIKDVCFGLSHISEDLWVLPCNNHTILSVRVDFSKCPILQY
jgi:hypothetical protein